MTIERRETGFKYGRYTLRVVRVFGEVPHQGRVYRLVEVETHEGQRYLSLRLYNPCGHFIKQLLVEPELAGKLAQLLRIAQGGDA